MDIEAKALDRRWIRVPDRLPRPVFGGAADFARGEQIPRHRHRCGQLVYAAAGVMTVSTQHGTWVVPPERAVWVPPETDHAIHMSGQVAIRTLYLDPAARADLPSSCRVVRVSPLLREAILRIVELEQPYPLGGREERLAAVVFDEMDWVPVKPLHLPRPTDPRLTRVTGALLAHPDCGWTLSDWARRAGASPRTLERLFQRETGMTFGGWRRQLRLLEALERLAAGESVTEVALSLGYAGPSAFIAMFRRHLGNTPREYFSSTTHSNESASDAPLGSQQFARRTRS